MMAGCLADMNLSLGGQGGIVWPIGQYLGFVNLKGNHSTQEPK